MMKKILITLALAVSILVPISVPVTAGAVDIFPNCGSGSAQGVPQVCSEARSTGGQGHSRNPIIYIIEKAIEVIGFVIGIASVIIILIGSIRFMTSGGDSSAVSSAKHSITYALVGLVLAISAEIIVVWILNKL